MGAGEYVFDYYEGIIEVARGEKMEGKRWVWVRRE